MHHNTLHALEHLPFEEAVLQAEALTGCLPYKEESWFRRELARGRILAEDLEAVLEAPSAQDLAPGVSRFRLQKALLLNERHEETGTRLQWHLTETLTLKRFRPEVPHSLTGRLEEEAVESLWHSCQHVVSRAPTPDPSINPDRLIRHRDFLVREGQRDIDVLVDPILVKFCAAFLDQGVAEAEMPHRDQGMWSCFKRLPRPNWFRSRSPLAATPEESVLKSLETLGVGPHEWVSYIRATLFVLKGWAGMVRQTELRPDRLPMRSVPTRLLDFLAIRLVLEQHALLHCSRRDLREIRVESSCVPANNRDDEAYGLFQLVQFLGITEKTMESWTEEQAQAVLQELKDFNNLERRRRFQLAYERRLRIKALDALSMHEPVAPAQPVSFQAIFCIDEREESTRRHLEEVDPNCQTFSTPGFFGIPMRFKALHEAHPVPLCPLSINPRHVVNEVANPDSQAEAERRAALRRSLGQVTQGVQQASHSLTMGGLLSSSLGIVTALPTLFRILFPRTAGRVGRKLRRRLLASETLVEIDGEAGFSVQEMAEIVASLLEEIGLTESFSDVILILGHGSSSLNNPHEAAYDCGACGGGRGGPNARVFAKMANHDEVRQILSNRGINIPSSTKFVGCYHNTCDEDLEVFDLQNIELEKLQGPLSALQTARERDAFERCRRFESASLDMTPRQALHHVQGRSQDLAQPRPECGHATNALAVIGRRRRTRGLFLDRRAFLVSYNPLDDNQEGAILRRLLRSVLPVMAGINLEYYFSFVDNPGYGCGSKLPHNITGLVGVMDGGCSDLRCGLPLQMVEIHEPVRLLTVIETRRDVLEKALAEEATARRLVANRWLQLARLDPDSAEIEVLGENGWTPHRPGSSPLPQAQTSRDWFHHNRDHLPFAEIRA